MSILSRPRFLPQQRLDLEDINALLAAARTDSKLYTKQFISNQNLIYKGFSVTGVGLKIATVNMADATLIIPQNSNDFSWFTAAPAEANIVIPDADLADGTRNYVEIALTTENNTPLTKAFWDPEANSGSGSEFNQIVATITDLKVNMIVSTGGFSGSPDRLPVCIIDVDGSGNIKTIFDRRNLFGRLGKPSNIDNQFSWGSKMEPAYALTLNGVSGTFTAGETITIGGETAKVVVGGTTAISFNVPSGINFFPGDTVTGQSSTATGTINTVAESFTGVDKSLKSQKDVNDALMTEFALVKGTRFWYENAQVSLGGIIKSLESVLVQATATAKFAWDGAALKITDENVSPGNDTLGYIRMMGRGDDLALTREDGTGGTSALTVADGEVVYVKIPTTGSRSFSSEGSGTTNYQTVDIASYQSSDENYWLAYREGTRLYIRGYGELEPGEEINIGDPELEDILAQIAANAQIVNQDRNIKLIDGGTWSVSASGTVLSMSQDANVQVPGLLSSRNIILATTLTFPTVKSVAYVKINRDSGSPSVRSVSVVDEFDTVLLNENVFVIARRVYGGILVDNSFMLKAGESLEMNGALAEINRYTQQLKLKKYASSPSVVSINSAESSLLTGDTLGQIVGNFLLKFDGAQIDFQTGDIRDENSFDLHGTFTPFTIPDGDFYWYGISLIPGEINPDNTQGATVQIDLADSSDSSSVDAPKPIITGTIKLGAVQVQNNGGAIQVTTLMPLGVGSGSGSGDGQGASFDAEMRTYLKLSPYEFLTENLIPVDQATKIDAASTGMYAPATKTFKQTAGQTLLSTELLDADFIAATRALGKARIILRYAEGKVDTAPVVAVQKNSGSFQTVTMSRIGNTDTFDGEIALDADVGTSLKVRVTASMTAEIYGYGVMYDTTFVAIPLGVQKNIYAETFSGGLNKTVFTLPYLPDPTALVVYDRTRGQSYIHDPTNTFSIAGNNVVFVADFFNFPTENISLEFRQIVGNGFDTSDTNANSIAANTAAIVKLDYSKFKNYLMNAESRFAQRQIPSIMQPRADATFGMDRWKVLSSGGNVGVQRVEDAPTQSPTRYCTRLRQMDASARQIGTVQFVSADNSIELRGKPSTLGFWVKTTGIQIPTIRAALIEWTGAADSVTGDIISSWAATPTLVASTSYVTTPTDLAVTSGWSFYEISGTFSTSTNNAGVLIYTPNVEGQNEEIFVTQVQLVRGTKARAWEAVSLSFDEDLRKCQEYYEKSYDIDTAPGTASAPGAQVQATSGTGGGSHFFTAYFRVTKIKIPTANPFTHSTGAINLVDAVTVNAANTATSFAGLASAGVSGSSRALILLSSGSYGPYNHGSVTYQWVAEAEIF